MREILLLLVGLGVVITAPFTPVGVQIFGALAYFGGVIWHWRRK